VSFQEKIVAAQRGIVDKLIEWEELISDLYTVYARRFPEQAELFEQMAVEEKEHAAALRGMHDLLDRGFLLENIGEFIGEHIDEDIAQVRRALKRAERPSVRLQDAVANARDIESSVIETQFYEVVSCGAPEFAVIAARLHGGTEGHLEKLRNLRA